MIRKDLELKARIFRGLAEPSRLAIMHSLMDGPKTVSELVRATKLTQPNVSLHLSCLLWECRLVTRERSGKNTYYSMVNGRVRKLLDATDKLSEKIFAIKR